MLKSRNGSAVQGAVLRSRPVLLIGVTDRQLVETFRTVTREAGLDLEDLPTAEQASGWLEDAEPAAILVRAGYEAAESVCLRVRSITKLSTVPIIGLTSEVTDLSFPEIYGWGGDDVARLHVPADVVPRLRGLALDVAPADPKPKGLAIVAAADRKRRIVVARVLRNAGFGVHFALEAGEIEQAARVQEVALVVADIGQSSASVVPVIERMRTAGVEIPWVLTAEPKRIPAARASTKPLTKVAVTDAFAPPENVLFVANELGRAGLTDGRASPRILYGAVVGFRLAGRDEDALGFAYNISAGGLYVRTLAPLSGGEEAWLELRPPRSDRWVRLEGKVAWRRRFGPIESATVPPGFGVQITDATKGEFARYLAGYEAFRSDVLGLSIKPSA